MSGMLADQIAVRGRFARSANVERDVAQREPLEGYVVTPRVLSVLRRIVSVARDGRAGGAWSLTGPYGSGKSSLALLIDAVFGPESPTRDLIMGSIAVVSAEMEAAILAVHARHGTGKRGFYRGLVTAGGESLSITVFRALQAVVGRSAQAITIREQPLDGSTVGDILRLDPRLHEISAPTLIRVACAIAEDAPLLIVIDEFGKGLEVVREHDDGTYLLQQLAEAGQGAGLPIFVLTLQHLSFEEYLVGSAAVTRREWAKVQGRFEDIAFVESAEQIRALIGSVFEPKNDTIRERIARWAAIQAEKMQKIGLGELSDPEAIEHCYPLHPITAAVLPELCNRFGQHERTLFSFLAGQGSWGAARFIEETEIDRDCPLPSITLEKVYDYFVGQQVLAGLSGREAGRWSEIATRVRDAAGLSDRQTRMAKRIAVLNLTSTAGVVRASRPMLSLTDPHAVEVLSQLEVAGVVTYRRFADEYRVWQGSDVNIPLLVDSALMRLQRRSLAELMSSLEPPAPMVAARHSAEKDVLRVFRASYASAADPVAPIDAFSQFDGEVLLVVDSLDTMPTPSNGVTSAKPIVAVIPREVSTLEEAAREVAAVQSAADEPVVAQDWVARGEVAERLAQAKAVFEGEVHRIFRSGSCRWFLLGEDNAHAKELPVGRGSHTLSCAADIAYDSTPVVGNEVLNRVHLTTQGSKARNLLLSAMITRGKELNMGLEGFGPEVAMYRAFLLRTGIHQSAGMEGGMVFCAPRRTSSLWPAWEVIERQFAHAKARRVNVKDIHAELRSRPVGMKAGVIPVLLTAALLVHRDEIAVYEHGTFRTKLAVEVSERMVRNPHHFEVKHFANTAGVRRDTVNALAKRLKVRPVLRHCRVANVLGVAGYLVSRIRRLDNFTRHTTTLSKETLAVRAAIMDAVEPDELIFKRLPAALSLPSVPAFAEGYTELNAYAELLGGAMDELSARFDALGKELLEALLHLAGEKTRQEVSRQAAALDDQVLNKEVCAFVQALQGGNSMTDGEWISRVATVISKKAPTEWTDRDLNWFKIVLGTHVNAFQRLVALHADYCSWGGGSSRGFRVTLTAPNGREHNRLISVDDADRVLVEEELDQCLAKLEPALGSRHQARKSILALLGEMFLGDQD